MSFSNGIDGLRDIDEMRGISRSSATVDEHLEPLLEDLADRWRRGDCPGVETYLELHPWLLEQPETALELIAEEVNLRLEAGEEPEPDDFARRFPLWESQVRALVECHRLLAARPAHFPSAGETIGDFRLLSELGRGAHGRVFLAAQQSLGERTIVLKLAPRLGDEHLSLSRLLHSNIVPLYAVFDFPEQGLRGLCQPYFGGATLADVQKAMSNNPVSNRRGGDLAQALKDAQKERISIGRVGLSPLFADSSYVETLCRIAACLADALHHAHERGLLHLDLKPSNVLLAADGQPMLLDFHLARPPLRRGDAASARLGGTPGYMPPEQEAALAAATMGQPAPMAVDRRADVYALGILLYEMLTDELPPVRAAGSSLRKRNSRVSRGLAAIVQRCLASDSSARYPTARALADDLRRELADLPLHGVANWNPVERWRKWRRRRPYALPLLVLLALGVVGGAVWSLRMVRQYQAAESAVREGEECIHLGRFAEAIHAFKYGTALADAVPFSDRLTQRLRDGRERAEQQLLIAELHTLVDQLRPLDGMDWLPAEQIQAAEQQCRNLWEMRAQIAEAGRAREDKTSANSVPTDLLDLGIVYANLIVRSNPQEDWAAHEKASDILVQAEEIGGPSCVLFREKANHARAAGRPELANAFERQAAELTPRNAWEHFAVGRAWALAGDWRHAIASYDRALALEPQSLWPQFARGLAAFQIGEFTQAHLSFSICVALAPKEAACVYNRGRTLMEFGQMDKAIQDFDRAAELAPSLVPLTALGRADIFRRKRQYDQALRELDRARNGVAPAVVTYHEAVIHLDRRDYSAAESNLRETLRIDPKHEPARRLLERIRLNQ